MSQDASGTGAAVPATDARIGAVKAEQRQAKREESTLRKVSLHDRHCLF